MFPPEEPGEFPAPVFPHGEHSEELSQAEASAEEVLE